MNHAHSIRAESEQDRYAQRVTGRLSQGTDELAYDISERLRAARMQALAQRKPQPVRFAAPVVLAAGPGTAILGAGGDGFGGWWGRIASALPVMALVAGMVAIHVIQDDNRAADVAEVDAALLTDDLPPSAYADGGFAQFLQDARGQTP